MGGNQVWMRLWKSKCQFVEIKAADGKSMFSIRQDAHCNVHTTGNAASVQDAEDGNWAVEE